MKAKILLLVFTFYNQCILSNSILKDTIGTNHFIVTDTVSKQNDWFTSPNHFILKQHLTAAIIVKSNPLGKSAFKSLQEDLQGKIAGLQIISQGGKISQDFDIFIRGRATLKDKDQPLIIIDGHRLSNRIWEESSELCEPLNPLSFINQYDIESVEVLKDGLAGALYGLQAANGAIVITTKRGYDSKPGFTFNSEIGIAQPSKKLDLMDRSQFIEMFKNSYDNSSFAPNYLSWQGILTSNFPYWQDPSNPNDPAQGPNTNWQKLIFRNSFMHNYNLSARGWNI